MTEEAVDYLYDQEFTPVPDPLPIAPPAVSFTEAPASANFKAHSSGGWTVQYTLRDIDEDLLLDRLARFIRKLEGMKFTPANGETYHPAPSTLPSAPAPVPPPTNNQPSPLPVSAAPVQVQQPQAGTIAFFEAQTLSVGSISDGRAIWKIKGGQWSKHGVTVWPEVLLRDTGIDVSTLDTLKVYSLAGYTATYELNEKGQPHKVIKLVRM